MISISGMFLVQFRAKVGPGLSSVLRTFGSAKINFAQLQLPPQWKSSDSLSADVIVMNEKNKTNLPL